MKDLNEGMEKWLPLIAMEKAGLRVLTIPQLEKQLAGKKNDAAIMFFDWHHKGGEMSFPTELRVINLDSYELDFHHPIGSFESFPTPNLKGAKMVTFNIEGLPRFGRTYRGDIKPDEISLPLPKHLTVADFKNKIKGLGAKAFFAVQYRGHSFVSPDVLANYNAETYPLINDKKKLVAAHLGMEGDILTFGLGSTMSSDWGPVSFSLKAKSLFGKSEKLDENFVRKEVRKAILGL